MKAAPAVATALVASALAWPARAQAPTGYAFDQPRLLAEQLLWGRFHGIRLLARACRARNDGAAALAYADWLERNQPRLLRTERGLARHYFGRDQAPPEALAAALGLRPELTVAEADLAAACATLPEALTAPRNDLETLYREHRQAASSGRGDTPDTWQEQE